MRRSVLFPALAMAVATPACAQTPLLTEPFTEYERGRTLELTWQTVSGQWHAESGQLIGRSADRGVCWSSASPLSGDQQIEVLITPRERVAPGGWAAAALVLWLGDADFWRLALVEGPQGLRYAELLERRSGVWQAQSEGPTLLEQLPDGRDGFEWQLGHTYRCRLNVSPERVLGEIADHATGDPLFRRGYALTAESEAVRRGRPGLMVDAMDAAFDDVRVIGVGDTAPAANRIAVLDTGMPDSSSEVITFIGTALLARGLNSRALSVPREPGEFAVPQDVGLLILPHTRRLPLGVVEGVDRYLRRRGNVILLGGPLADETLVFSSGEWRPLAEALATAPTDRVAIDFAKESPDAWQRQHSPDEGPADKAIDTPAPTAGGRSLRVHAANLRNWDTLARGFEVSPFGDGQTLTCFWAKAGPKTTHLTVEWDERDGSRWMTSVPLSRDWRRHVLRPQDFAYWQDNPARARGGLGDHFRPENAAVLVVGLTKSHSSIADGPHTYWIADVGVARPPFSLAEGPPPTIEAVSPAYKTFEQSAARDFVASPDQAVIDPAFRLPAPNTLRCALPRTRGLGLKGARCGRWVPLLSARDAKGAERGCAASLFVSLSEPYPEAAWGMLGIEDPAYLLEHQAEVGSLLAAMARWLLDGVHLAKAGADQFACLPDQRPVLGGQVANRSGEPQDLRLRLSVSRQGRETDLFTQTWPVSAADGTLTGASAEWAQPVEPGTYRVRTNLLRGERVLDAICHEFARLPEPAAEPSDFVTVRDGDFRLGGKCWHPHGINYWPSNATGLEEPTHWLHWLEPANYDPAIIERDLQALADLKLNSVSILLGDREQLPACLHFLSRCAHYGIRANIFVGGGDPVGFNVERVVDLIEAGSLAGNPAIWAWDIAWEPHFGAYDARKALDPKWAQWIADRYGSLDNAERDWKCPVPRTPEGAITNPSQEQILNDGDHRVMVAAYRRFLDDLVSDSYGRWARAVRAVDPRHLIGVRSGYGGTGQPWIDLQMPFDLASGAKHLDFISPEGYGLGGPWESFEQGGFTTEYARHAGGGKPVFWAEFGMSLHPEYTPERLEAQRLLYEHLYRMVLWSGASGSAGWWFPGGFRVGEDSDYGIIGPDGTPRPSALEAREWAERMAQPRNQPPPAAWITIDRDSHPRGYSQVWLAHRDEYVKERRAGRWVGLRNEGTDTDSTNTPMVAIGNTRADGSNPPKYLDAEFNLVRLRVGQDWVEVAAGATVEVPAGRRIEAFVSVGNTGEALWVSPAHAAAKPGGVQVVSGPGSALQVEQPIPGDVPRFSDAQVGPFVLSDGVTQETPVALRLEAKGRTPFGAVFRFTLRPR